MKMLFNKRFFHVILGVLLSSPIFAASQSNPTKLPLSNVTTDHGSFAFNKHLGEVILVDFWASWCGPCRQSFPWMNEMQSQYKDQGFKVVAINLDHDKPDADKFLKAVPSNFTIGFDAAGKSAEQMKVAAMPMSFLIDRSGNVRYTLTGFNLSQTKEHEDLIRQLLKESNR